MSTPISSVNNSGTSSDGTVVNMAALARLEKLERTLGQQLKSTLDAVSRNPLDSTMKELAAQLAAEFADIQAAITSLLGTATIKQKTSVGPTQAAEIQALGRSQAEHGNVEKAAQANPRETGQQDDRKDTPPNTRVGTFIDELA